MVTQSELAEIYKCVISNTKLSIEIDENVVKYVKIFEKCVQQRSNLAIEQAEIDENVKNYMKKVIENYGKEEKSNVEWAINIVAANSHVAKSLRPVINIKMPNAEGKELEFDLDSFAQFRLQLAHAVAATVHK